MNHVNQKKLKASIARCGLTNESLAHKIQVNRGTISNVLTGKTKPSYQVVNGCFHVLHLTPLEVVEIFYAINVLDGEPMQVAGRGE
ncbi:helix-turn-helix transcriptional regulator [Fundicoccus sp. Sow4_F4]|uniref:helix-turn-helix transcriptional regulator n=1 Tax=Fundicoccus sp. Sow4_F4 TaxID=3438783 RepID=UPI003F90B3A9